MNRRDFIQKLTSGVFGAMIAADLIPNLLTRSYAQTSAPFEFDPLEFETAYITAIGVGPTGARMAKRLSLNCTDIECHEIICSPKPGWTDNFHELLSAAANCHLVFILTGFDDIKIAPLIQTISETARANDTLTVGVASRADGDCDVKCFDMLTRSCEHLDTLFSVSDTSLSVTKAQYQGEQRDTFEGAAMLHTVATISDLIIKQSLIGIDLADVLHILRTGSQGWLGSGIASGPNHGQHAAQQAITQLTNQEIPMTSVTGALVCIHGSSDMTMEDFEEASMVIHNLVPETSDILIGFIWDEALGPNIQVTAMMMT